MTDRRNNGNGNGAGHYRGEGKYTDPTENVKELVELQALRQDEARGALALRVDQRDKLREVHRLEIAKKDAEILSKEIERSKAEAATEKLRVDAVIASDRAAVLLANTEAKAVAAALVVQVETARKTSDAQIESSAAALRATNDATAKAQNARFEPLEQARFAAVGVKEQRTEGRQSNAAIYALVGLIVTLLLFLMAAVTFVVARTSPTL